MDWASSFQSWLRSILVFRKTERTLMGWLGFAAVFLAFFVSHSVPVRPQIKSRIVRMIGVRGFGVVYSCLSLAMLALLVWAAGNAPYLEIWPQALWQRHVTHIGMLAVCLVLALSIARPNPFSFGGARNEQYDPSRPGVTRLTRHPVLAALALWAGVHLLPNGDVAHVILFGVLGAFAIAGRSLIDWRKRNDMGNSQWEAFDRSRRSAPFLHAPASWTALATRMLFGIIAFVALIWLHPHIIGASVF